MTYRSGVCSPQNFSDELFQTKRRKLIKLWHRHFPYALYSKCAEFQQKMFSDRGVSTFLQNLGTRSISNRNKNQNKIPYYLLLSSFYLIKLWKPHIIRYRISVLIPIGNRPTIVKILPRHFRHNSKKKKYPGILGTN